MKKNVYILEVGVHIDEKDKEYEYYEMPKATPTTKFGYYDENCIWSFDYNKLKKYADDYVKGGVNNTYAFIYEDIYNLEQKDINCIKDFGYADYDRETPNITEWAYYIYKNDNGEIVTMIDYKNGKKLITEIKLCAKRK